MICWDRSGGQVIGNFTPRQIRWIRDHVGNLRLALQLAQDQSQHLAAPHTGTEHDQAELAPEHSQQGFTDDRFPYRTAWSAMTATMTPGLIRRIRVDADLVLETLPRTGGVAVLPEGRHAWAWIWSLSECGKHVAFRLDVDWERSRSPIPMTMSDDNRKQRSVAKVATWLDRVIGGLIDVAELPYSAVSA